MQFRFLYFQQTIEHNKVHGVFVRVTIFESVCVCATERVPEGIRSLSRSKHRHWDNIKMNVHDIGLDGLDWIYLAVYRHKWRDLVNTVINICVA
jgi:hypothetical protein